jgi:hypothetical protein
MTGTLAADGEGDSTQFAEFDDVIEMPFGVVARKGRFILARGLLTEEESEAFRKELLEGGLAEMRARMESLQAELVDLLKSMDPLEMLMQFAVPYLSLDPNTYREWETDRLASHVEYLAMQVVGLGKCETQEWTPQQMSEGLTRVEAIIKDLFALQYQYVGMSTFASTNPGDIGGQLRVAVLLHSLAVRIPSYGEHEVANLRGIFEPLDDLMLSSFGFTIDDAIAIAEGVGDPMLSRLEERLEAATVQINEDKKRIKRARRKPQSESDGFYKAMAGLRPSDVAEHLMTIAVAWAFHGSRETFRLTADSLAEHLGLDPGVVDAFMRVFTIGQDLYDPEHHRLPPPGSPLLTRPLIPVEGGWLCPIPAYLLYAIRPRLEESLLDDDAVWDRYSRTRSRFVEVATAELLANALGTGSEVWTRIGWTAADLGLSGEIDVAARQDVVGIRVECKAGRLTAPARRGGIKRMDSELRSLVGDAATQHSRLDDALARVGVLAIESDNHTALTSLADAPLSFQAIVTLEELGLFGAQMFRLEEFGTLSGGERVPWLVSLNDLRVIAEILSGPEFCHYLARRERLNRIRRVVAADELDYLGNYLSEGLFFDEWAASDPEAYFRLLSYTEDFDNWYFAKEGLRTIETPMPSRPTSARVAQVVAALVSSRPEGWMVASMAMLDWSSETQGAFDQNWDAAVARAQRNGEASFTLEIGTYRFAMVFALERTLEDLKARLSKSQTEILNQRGFSMGIAVGRLPPPTAYTVVLVGDKIPAAIDAVFLEPDLGRGHVGEEDPDEATPPK